MTSNTNLSRNTMSQLYSENLKTQNNTDIIELLMISIMFVMTIITGFVISKLDNIDKKPVLPFTIYDTCSSTSISVSPTYSNTIRRVSSSDGIVTSV